MTGPTVMLVAAEASGDDRGAALARAIRARAPQARFVGVGGARMRAEGVESPFDFSELSVLGLWEGLQAYPKVVRRADETAALAAREKPDVAVLIDSWGFTYQAGLRVKWAYQMDSRAEVSPIVVDGVMYVSGPNTAAALDVRTGRELWTWRRPIPKDYQNIGFGRVNRGPAILDDQIFVATLDCYLVALDAKSGLERWSAKVEDYKPGYSMTLAPLAIRGKVLVGVSGGETGIRGFVDAYDAKTGSRVWRFHTIPGPGEPGNETWPGDSWKTGGGSTWVTGSYDPETNLVYWGIGNPGPDWNPDSRRGDNLYTCSLVALDGDTGKLKWHFQFTPNDSHDWDSTHVPVLFEAEVRGARRKLVAVANRNAFYYVLDRSTGEFVAGRPYAKQTWAKGLDDRGSPIVIPDTEPSDAGTLVWPNLNGATVWFSPSYSPREGLLYVAVREIA